MIVKKSLRVGKVFTVDVSSEPRSGASMIVLVRFSAMLAKVAAAAVGNDQGYLPFSVIGLSLGLAGWRRRGVQVGMRIAQ